LKNGELVRPDACARCRTRITVVAHHEDYARPLEVIWLCDACHRRRHVELKLGGRPKKKRAA
jgi:hypothetical protein